MSREWRKVLSAPAHKWSCSCQLEIWCDMECLQTVCTSKEDVARSVKGIIKEIKLKYSWSKWDEVEYPCIWIYRLHLEIPFCIVETPTKMIFMWKEWVKGSCGEPAGMGASLGVNHHQIWRNMCSKSISSWVLIDTLDRPSIDTAWTFWSTLKWHPYQYYSQLTSHSTVGQQSTNSSQTCNGVSIDTSESVNTANYQYQFSVNQVSIEMSIEMLIECQGYQSTLNHGYP